MPCAYAYKRVEHETFIKKHKKKARNSDNTA